MEDFIIPKNYKSQGKYRKLIEAIIFALIPLFIISNYVPFVFRLKVISIVFFGILFFIGGLVGIKGQSVTEFLQIYIVFLYKRKKYHLRKVTINGKRASTNRTSDRAEYIKGKIDTYSQKIQATTFYQKIRKKE